MNDTLHTSQGLPLSPEQSFALHNERPPLHLGVCMAGALQPRQLYEALLQVVERHTSLRVALRASSLYRSLRQHVVEASVEWHVLDAELSGTDYQPHCAVLAGKPFDLERGCLVRAALSQPKPNEWRLDLWVAACAGDRLSLQNLYAELVQLYEHPAATLEDAFEYSQYVEWRNDLDADEDAPGARAYWAALGLEALAPLQLGYRREPGYAGANQVMQATSNEVALAVERLADQYAQPPGTLLQAAWWLLLARISGQSAFVAGWQQDCRVDYEALANGIGVYEKVLPLALTLDLNAPFETWLQHLANQLEQHTQHQEHWNVATATTTLHRKVGFNLVSRSPVIRGASVHWSADSLPGVADDFELALHVSLDEHGNAPHFSLHAPAGHLGEHDLQCLLEQYACLLTALAAAPERGPLRELALSPAGHRERQLQLSGPRRDFGSQAVIERLAEWARQTPDAPALQAAEHTLTYRQLHQQVEHLAGALRARGIGRESKVALLLPRSVDLILGVLAVLRAGASYVPLDPAWPEARREKILADAQPQLLIGTDQGVSLAQLRDAPANPVAITAPIELGDAAYLLYTSGTSGEPKGVVIEHAQLLNYTAAISEALGLDQCKRFALISSVAADLGNTTLYGALWNGGCLVVASDQAGRDAAAFARFVREQRIDCLKIVPSHLAALLEDQASTLPQVLILGGEPCPAAVCQRIQELAPDCRVHNHYGPTETTVGVLYSDSQAFDTQLPLDLQRALANTYALVLEPTTTGWQLAPLGALGEVCIGGAQVSRGYLNRSSQAFIDDPLQPGQRLYRTGDLARLSATGHLQLAGRSDQQIKVRGFRVEPGELEAALLALAGVSQAVVHFRAGQLLAYVVSTRPGAELLMQLRNLLPDYLTPSHLLCVPALPRLANGKIDYAALPAPDSLATRQAEQPPRDALEALLADLYKELLERDSVSITDNLFDLGGHSLIVIKLCTRLRNLLQLEVPPATVFDHPSIAALADALRAQESQPGKLLKIAELRRMLAAMPAEERAALQARALAGSQPEASRT